jgi:hypothetical protein
VSPNFLGMHCVQISMKARKLTDGAMETRLNIGLEFPVGSGY